MRSVLQNLKEGLEWTTAHTLKEAEQEVRRAAEGLAAAQARLLEVRDHMAATERAIAVLEVATAKEEAEKNG